MISDNNNIKYTPKSLTPKVLQVSDALGLYGAEVARVLHLKCADINAMASTKKLLNQGEVAWHYAILFVELYQNLYLLKNGDDVSIYHWFRINNPSLGGTPLMLIVDHDKLIEVSGFIKNELIEFKKVYENELF